MRHLKGRRKLNRTTSHRLAMFRNMVTSLLRHEQIVTTEPKARELKRIVERVITLSRRVPFTSLDTQDLAKRKVLLADRVHAVRLARRWVRDRDVLQRLFEVYSTRFASRPGGYTRLVKLGNRPGDNAPMCMIQLLDAPAAGSGAESAA